MKRTCIQVVIDHADMTDKQQAELISMAEGRIFTIDAVKDVSAVLKGQAPAGLHPVMHNGAPIPGIYSLVAV